MKKVINGKRYDTERAKRVCSDGGKTLYRKKTGEFFLHSDLAGFELLSYEDARAWVKQHDAGAHDSLFGTIEEDSSVIMTSYSLPADLVEQVRRKASETGKTQSTIVAEAIKKILIGESGGSEQ